MTPRWDHFAKFVNNDEIDKELHAFSAQGWELVTVINWGDWGVKMFFRRPRELAA